MRRHVQAQAKLDVAKQAAIKPERGLFVCAYWDNDCGSGYRPAIVLSIGPTFVTLFYTPTLARFQITHNEWALLNPQPYEPSLYFLRDHIRRRADLFIQIKFRFSLNGVSAALAIINEKLKAHIEREQSNVNLSHSVSADLPKSAGRTSVKTPWVSGKTLSFSRTSSWHNPASATDNHSIQSPHVKRRSRKAKTSKERS